MLKKEDINENPVTYTFVQKIDEYFEYDDVVTFELTKSPTTSGYNKSTISGQFKFQSNKETIRNLFTQIVINQKFIGKSEYTTAIDRFNLTKEALVKTEPDMEKYIYSQDLLESEKNIRSQDLLHVKKEEVQAQKKQKQILKQNVTNSDKINAVLDSLKASLTYRKTLYTIKPEKIKKWNIHSGTEPIDNKKRAEKLAATEKLIAYVDALQKENKNKIFTQIDQELNNSRAAKNGELGKIREQIKKARDAIQEISIKRAEKAFKTAEQSYKNLLSQRESHKNKNQPLLKTNRLEKILAELHYRKTLYIQRKNSHAHVHFFNNNEKSYKSAQKKLCAANLMIDHVNALLAHLKDANQPKPGATLEFDTTLSRTAQDGRLGKIFNEIRTVELSQGIESKDMCPQI